MYQFFENVAALFSGGRDKTTDTRKALCSGKCSETTGYLLLDLGRSQIPLCQIIGKRDIFELSKCQDIILVFRQAVQQIAAPGLFGSSSGTLFFRRRFLTICLLADAVVFFDPNLQIFYLPPTFIAGFV